ncbi:MAG: hypothetical protein WC552_08895 [Candidatus Omnitrophota bacterium]
MPNLPLKIFSFLNQNKKAVALVLTVISGVVILWPLLDFQYFLAQGDHGRELYGYRKTLDGGLAYRDFSWPFGPLLTYYYSTFYRLFGVKIQSVLLGQNLILLAVGVLMFLICSGLSSPAIGYLCAVWYWAFRGSEFFYCYHHIGGVSFVLLILWATVRYLQSAKRLYVFWGFAGVFCLLLTRLNMGLAVLAAYVLSLFFLDYAKKDTAAAQKRKFYVLSSAGVLLLAGFFYWLIVRPVPFYVIYQSFPYGNPQRGDNPVNVFSALRLLGTLINSKLSGSLSLESLGVFVMLALAQFLYLLLKKRLPPEAKKELSLVFTVLLIFLLFAGHELLLGGTWFRFFWAHHIVFIIIFYLLYCLIRFGSKKIFTPLVRASILTLFLVSAGVQAVNSWKYIQLFKNPWHLLQYGENKVYTTQPPDWFFTVFLTTDFLRQNTREDEKIFALPHDSLYYFLSGRDSGTRQLDFFEHNFIPEEQERATIADLKRNKVNWIVLSNRSSSLEQGMGVLGETHCLILSAYITEHFETAASFGDVNASPGWVANHAVKILKRKSPLE